MNESDRSGPANLADKLDLLFRTVRPRSGDEYSYREVAQAINDSGGGATISAGYVWQLRKGVKTNPSVRHVEALARFFGVPPAYFLDDEAVGEIAAQLELLAAIRDSDVRDIALRANGLSDAALTMIKNLIENTRQLEGLPDDQ